MRGWSFGFILAGVFFLGFGLGYPFVTLHDPGLVDLIIHNPLLKVFALATLAIGLIGLRHNQANKQ